MFDVACAVCHKVITEKSQEVSSGGDIITTAVMKSDRVFSYGISGQFQFTDDLGLSLGDFVCNDCLKKSNFEPYLSVKCCLCGADYQSTGGSSKQGMGCSCFVDGKELVGSWGSIYDCSVFDLKSMNLHNNDNVCDSCVEKLAEQGDIEFVEERPPF